MPVAADPDLALRLTKETVEVYSAAVDSLLDQVTRRLARGIDELGWAEAKLLELAQLRNAAVRELETLAVLGPKAVDRALTEAFKRGARDAAAELKAAEASIRFGATNTRAVDALIRETVGLLEATHPRILRTVIDTYRQVIEETAAQTVTGAVTRRQAAQRALDRFADRGVTGFVDRAGRSWDLASYSEMATRTAVGRAQVAGALDRFSSAGRDLVIVSDAPGECAVCRDWEGQVLSITGAPGYPSVDEAEADGLFHANCRHHLGAYIEGVTEPFTHTADPDGDAARQEQRRLERGVRQWKRRASVSLDDTARRTANAKAAEWQARLKTHVDDNDLKRQRHRERLGAR